MTWLERMEREGEELMSMSDPRAAWPDRVSRLLLDLAKRCTDFDSHRRPFIREVAIEMSGMSVEIGVALYCMICRFCRSWTESHEWACKGF